MSAGAENYFLLLFVLLSALIFRRNVSFMNAKQPLMKTVDLPPCFDVCDVRCLLRGGAGEGDDDVLLYDDVGETGRWRLDDRLCGVVSVRRRALVMFAPRRFRVDDDAESRREFPDEDDVEDGVAGFFDGRAPPS